MAVTTLAVGESSAGPSANGHVSVFARIGAPGQPSLTLVTPNQRRVFVGTFEDVTGSNTDPSKVFEYDDHGKLLKTFVIKGQTPGQAHGVQVAARDRKGRLYVLDQEPARAIVLDPKTGSQHNYASFADVPTCVSAGRATGCSNTVLDNAPEPDYAAWLPDGSMLVTDFAQQLIWRVPAHGGKARVWFNSARLDGELFGPAGIVLMPGRRSVLVSAATGGITTLNLTNNSARGRLYRIHLTKTYRPGAVKTLWSSDVAQAPDGFAVAADGKHVFIALVGPAANCVVELARTPRGWRQVWQVPSCIDGLGSDSPVPWDSPTSVQFLHHSILVTNQAFFTGIASHWVIFRVTEPLRGMRIYVPANSVFERAERDGAQ
jgi:sugar lactone lactonase YvrE